jgi:hypothetical protein
MKAIIIASFLLMMLLPAAAQAGSPASCTAGQEWADYIKKRGCNGNIDGQIMWFPSRRAFHIYRQDMNALNGGR